MKTIKMLTILVIALGLVVWQAEVSKAAPMGTAWTYQGRLIDANSAADGLYDFQFELYDGPNTIDSNQIGGKIDVNDFDVIDGYFTVELDFGSDVFDGDARWLEVGIRPGDSSGSDPYSILMSRTEVKPTPYSLFASYAASTPDDGDWGVRFGQILYSIPPGNVGIGTANPLAKLEVVGNIMISNGSSLWGKDSGGTGRRIITGYSDDNLYVGDFIGPAWLDVAFGAGGAERMRIKSTGHVGIGTDQPELSLDVEGTIRGRGEHASCNGDCPVPPGVGVYGESDTSPGVMGVSVSGAGLWGYSQQGYAGLFYGNVLANYDVYVLGNMGVGTDQPEYALDVDGTIRGRGEHASCNGDCPVPPGVGVYGESDTNPGVMGVSVSGAGLWGYSQQGYAGLFYGNVLANYDLYVSGNVGIGTTSPASGYKLDVEGKIQADTFDTGDITFRKNSQILWRMFENEEGLYLENVKTGKVYSFVLQEAENENNLNGLSNLEKAMKDLQTENNALKQRLESLERTIRQERLSLAR